MPSRTRTLSCHWEVLKGPDNGRIPGPVVWICEYPYRTIRTGPADDCEGCRRATTLVGAARSTHDAFAS